MSKQALLFSGQGSQYKGMFSDYADTLKVAKEKLEQADDLLGYKISEIMFDLDSDRITETRYTQPAIYIHSTLAYDYVKNELTPHGAGGHSIGEYAALYAAGVLDWETGLKLVSKRGQLMFDSGKSKPGTMFAVVGAKDDAVIEVAERLTESGNGKVVVAANFNSPGQIVVSGDKEYLIENASRFKEAGAKIVKELNVSGAFHSPLLKNAQDELQSIINTIEFSDSTIPVYQNVDAKPHTNSSEIKENLIKQLTGSVLWSQSLSNMEADGFSSYVEIGPGKVLQGLVKRTVNADKIIGVDKHEDILNYKG
jgi:[acyl-carrier-protein] S-malonyltransferase